MHQHMLPATIHTLKIVARLLENKRAAGPLELAHFKPELYYKPMSITVNLGKEYFCSFMEDIFIYTLNT